MLHTNSDLNCLQLGRAPHHLFSRPFNDDESGLLAAANKPLSYGKACVAEYGGDWPERCFICGVKNHGGSFPCTSCTCDLQARRAAYGSCNFLELPWMSRSHDMYLEEVASHLMRVELPDDETRELLVELLFWSQSQTMGTTVWKTPAWGAPFPTCLQRQTCCAY